MKKSTALFLVFVLIATMIIPMQISAAENNYSTVMYKVNYQGSQSTDNKYVSLSIKDANGTSESGYSMSELTHYQTSSFETSYGFDLEVNFENLTYTEKLFVDTTDKIILLDIVITDTAISFERVEADANVEITPQETGYSVAYKVEDGGMVYDNKVVASGSYTAVLSRVVTIDDKKTLEIIEKPFTVSPNDEAPLVISDTATQTKALSLTNGAIPIINDQIEYMGKFIDRTGDIAQVFTNADFEKITRRIQSFDNTEFYDMILPNLSVDLTSLSASVVNPNLYYYLNIIELLSIKDAQENPIIFNYINSNEATYTIKNTSDETVKQGKIESYLQLDTLFGPYQLELELTDFGLSISTPIDVKASNGSNPGGDGGNPGGGDPATFYKDYQVEVTTAQGAPIEKAYTLYDTSKNEVVIYIPENTAAKVEIRGVNEDDTLTEPLRYTIDNSGLAHHQFNPDTNFMDLGATHRGYSDGMFGSVIDGPRIELQVFVGKLGIMTVNDIDGLPHSGEINYNISYETMDGNAQGSNSNTYSRNGKFFVPIQDELLSLKYAYAILSPSVRNNQKIQANTPWIDLTDTLLNNTGAYYNLGTTQFQEVEYTGYLFNSDTTPLNNTLVSAYPELKPSETNMPPINMMAGIVSQGGIGNVFYLASLGDLFTENFNIQNSDFSGGTTPIRANLILSDVTGNFYVPEDQLRIELMDDQGNLLINQNGYDKHVHMKINNGYYNSIFVGGGNIVNTGGLNEGDVVSLKMMLDEGDFDYAKLNDSRVITFTFTKEPGDHEAIDSQGQTITYTVDEDGVSHLSLNARKTQLYAKVYQGATLVSGGVTATLYDSQNNQVAFGRVHSGQMVGEGILNLGAETNLSGEYTLFLTNPENTVNYYGKSYTVTLPQGDDEIVIQMPESRVFGQLSMIPEDEVLFNNNINRVYVNIFDATGKYVKNALVRNDGLFTAGNLPDGKYYAKVFISPLSNIASKYNSSKMQIFEVNASNDKATFALPLYQVIQTGHVVAPNGDAIGSTWVRLYNAQNVEIEAVLANDQGEFQIPRMADGKYFAKAFGTNGLFDSKFQGFEIKNGVLIGNIDLALSSAELTGRILSEVNNVAEGVEGIQVLLYDADLSFITSVHTLADGTYQFGGLTEGDYLIQARPSTDAPWVTTDLIKITYAGTLLTTDITLAEGTLIGYVKTPQNVATSDAWVHLYEDDHYIKSLPVDSNGSFKLGALDADKTYQLTAISKTGAYEASVPTAVDSETTTIELKLRQNIGVSGVLKSGSEVLSNTKYLIYDATGKAMLQGNTNVFGELSLIDLPLGKYYVVVPMNDYYLKAQIQISNNGQSLGDINLQRGVN